MPVFDILPPRQARKLWQPFQIKHPSYLLHSLILSVMLVVVILFAWWWFDPRHIPGNFLSTAHILDVLLFLLVSYVIWQPIMMEVLTWMISLQVKPQPHLRPQPGMKVAFITTIVPKMESIDLLHNILPAMVRAEYPHDSWLLDEGNDPEVRAICERYGVKHFSRQGNEYLNTTVGKFTKTKGGNHNSWYAMEGDAYDVVAQIDTDFVPERTFLSNTLGHFRDPEVAFVGTPQVYGNTDNSLVARGAAEQLYNFYGPVLQGLSGIEMSLMIGANHVVRVAALKSVDHYTAHITEDLITGMKLHAQGWKSVYVPQPLATGEGPFTWEAYFGQQMRWAYGCIDILFRLSPRLLMKMGLRRMLHYFFLMQYYFSGVAMALSIALLSLYFAFGIRAANVDLMRFVVIYSVASLGIWMGSVWLQQFHIAWKQESHLFLAGTIINVAAWPIYFLAFVTALFRRRLTYKVTPKGNDGQPTKTPLSLFTPHLVFGAIAAIGVVSSFFTHRQSPVMMFWGVTSATLMLGIPFAETVAARASQARVRFGAVADRLLSSAAGQAAARDELAASQTKEKLADCVFLGAIVVSSMVLYIKQLGFYSDDWSFIGNFSAAADHSLIGLIRAATTPNTFMRPVQNVYDALLFWLFGLHPLGYQLVNAAVFTTIVILFYLVLRQLRLSRVLAVSVPLVFALLPNYATDRFWYAAFQVNLSIMLYLMSLLAGLKAISPETRRVMQWKALSLVTLVFSLLSYEVVLPLALINMLLFLSPQERLAGPRRKRPRSQAVFITLNLAILGYLVVFKAATTTRLGSFNFPGDVVRILTSTVHTNFVTMGIEIPRIWLLSLLKYSQPQAVVMAVVLALGIGVYLYRLLQKPGASFSGGAVLRNLVLAGVAVFFLGYAIFYTNNQVGFSPTGIDNRVAIAAALGIACIMVGVLGWIVRRITPGKLPRFVFSGLMGIVCAGGFLVINSIATFWTDASSKQQAVMSDIHAYFPDIAPGSTVLLDGVCPYAGPGVVFESQWDLAGALQAQYHDPSLRADVVTPRTKVTPDGIHTQIYTFKARHSYSYSTYVYNFKNKGIYLIDDEDSANNYFHKFNPDRNSGCPAAVAGNGVSIY